MNAHQKYVANIIKGLKAGEVAALVAVPPPNRATNKMGASEIQDMIIKYATPDTAERWADLLADAAGCSRDQAWPVNWALPIVEWLDALAERFPVADASENVTSIQQAACCLTQRS